MIIITDKPGQLGNQLWAFSNTIAIAKELNESVYVVFDNNSYNLFSAENFSKKGVHIIPSNKKKVLFIRRIILFIVNQFNLKSRWYSLFRKFKINVINEALNERELYKQIVQSKITFINSWEQRDSKTSISKQQEFITTVFRPTLEIQKAVSLLINEFRKNYDLLIGVHIRRGDYKDFQGGKYYFSDEVYRAYQKKVAALFAGKKIKFYIFSNEKIELQNFSGLDTYFNPAASSVYDMWAMSQCDYIIGPLSTFSMWASFWNKTPLYIMDAPNNDIEISQFKKIIAQDKFENE
jgi:hypothetical protein